MDDPKVKDFMDGIDRVNGAGKRMPGFVWMMEGSGAPGNTGAKVNDDPRYISNLTVWENLKALETFVWGPVHKHYYDRKAEWFEISGQAQFVMWHVPVGHHPTLEEGLDRLSHLNKNGPSDYAFGWAYAKDMQPTAAGTDASVLSTDMAGMAATLPKPIEKSEVIQ